MDNLGCVYFGNLWGSCFIVSYQSFHFEENILSFLLVNVGEAATFVLLVWIYYFFVYRPKNKKSLLCNVIGVHWHASVPHVLRLPFERSYVLAPGLVEIIVHVGLNDVVYLFMSFEK